MDLDQFRTSILGPDWVQGADVVLGDNLEHGLGHHPESVRHSGSDDDQVT